MVPVSTKHTAANIKIKDFLMVFSPVLCVPLSGAMDYR